MSVSRRTTVSLAGGLVAALLAVVLVLLVRSDTTGQHHTMALVLLALVGTLALVGASMGIERAWTAWSTDRPLAVNAAVGTAVGLASWISALIVTAPLW